MKHDKTLGAIAMILGAILYASLSIGIRLLYAQGVPESSVTPIFTIVVALSATIWSIVFHRDALAVPRVQWFPLLFQGLIGVAAMNFLYYKALEILPASIAIMLLFLNPVFIFIFHWVVERKKQPIKRFVALGLVILGLLAISGILTEFITGTNSIELPLYGVVLATSASLCYGFMQLNVERRLGGIKPAVIAMYSSSAASFVLVLIYGPNNIMNFNITTESILSLTLLGVFTGLAPLLLIYFALTKIGAFTTSMIGTIELPVTALLGYIFLSEQLLSVQWIGMISILIGVVLVQSQKK